MNGVIHEFGDRLEYSAKLSDEPAWVDFYRRLWPNMVACVRVDKDCKLQRVGVDRLILLPDGKQVTVDEKKRERDYGDLLLEEWSVAQIKDGTIVGTKVGWALDPSKQCDYVAYSVPVSGKCFLLPFDLTRITFAENIKQWKAVADKGYPSIARNNGYVTVNVPVAWDRFRNALTLQMHRRFGSSVPLPIARQDGQQLSFAWSGQPP